LRYAQFFNLEGFQIEHFLARKKLLVRILKKKIYASNNLDKFNRTIIFFVKKKVKS